MSWNNSNSPQYYSDDYEVDLLANDSHAIAARLIGRDKRILEIGTSTGPLTKILSSLGNTVVGIEIDPVAAEKARDYCEQLIIADVETLDFANYFKQGEFDCIIMTDLLEHLKWPQNLLGKTRPYLSDNGFLVVSIPNICHGDVILNMLRGNFQYREKGLLDFTHLRFFALKNIIDLFYSTGYNITDLRKAPYGIGETELKITDETIPEIILSIVQAMPDSDIYQYVFRAEPADTPRYPLVRSSSLTQIASEAGIQIQGILSVLKRENQRLISEVSTVTTSLYLSKNNKFDEDLKISKQTDVSNHCLDLTFDLSGFGEIDSLRFDPVEGRFCTITIKEIKVTSSNGETIDVTPEDLEINGERISENQFQFFTTDPWIIIPVSGTISRMTISGDWIIRSGDETICSLNQELADQNQKIIEFERTIQSLRQTIAVLDENVNSLNKQHQQQAVQATQEIHHLKSENIRLANQLQVREHHPVWQIFQWLAKLAPDNTWRRKTAEQFFKSFVSLQQKNKKEGRNWITLPDPYNIRIELVENRNLIAGNIDESHFDTKNGLKASGWAIHPLSNRPVDQIIVTTNEGDFISFSNVTLDRPDIAKKYGNEEVLRSGWKSDVPSKNTTGYKFYSYDKNKNVGYLIKEIRANHLNPVFFPDRSHISLARYSHDTVPMCHVQDMYRAYQPVDKNDAYESEITPIFSEKDITLIAFYLPQFHPFPENDRFWGKGFTEWTNTTKAAPFFPGHYQPRLPGELGFYDTRVKEVLQRQIELAKVHGIAGFCLYHYWFQGKPVMRVPYQQIMDHEDLDIPFCLCWANEPWTARFDGLSHLGDALIAQVHTPEDDIAFFKDIEKALKDKRYIRIDGKPLLIIYRPGLFPDIKETITRWQNLARAAGIGELFMAMVQNSFDGIVNPAALGFDAAIEFPPQNIPLNDIKHTIDLYDPEFQGYVFDYAELIKKSLERKKPDYTLFRGICPDWDCTPRRKNPVIMAGSTPDQYQKWVEGLCHYTRNNLLPEHQFIFINAWNEWAEGAYLEPDRKFGYAYLNATSRALMNAHLKIAVVIHLFYDELAGEIITYLHNIPLPFDLYISTPHNRKSKVKSIFHKEFSSSTIVVKGVDNRGFDIAPFLVEFSEALRAYDLVLKIHGKLSTHWNDNHLWRRYLMENLLGSEQIVRTIFNKFTETPGLGMLFPENLPILKEWLGWANNFPTASKLFEQMHIQVSESSAFEYPAGSMYWFRPEALSPLFGLDIPYSDFDAENNRDGTLAHAIERSVIFAVKESGYTWQKVSYYNDKLMLNDKWNNLIKEKFGNIAVILHLYYIDLADEFIIYLKNIPYHFDLYISTRPEYAKTITDQFRQHFPGAFIDVRGVENYGYDIYPFISVFKERINRYDYVCKIHTKKSEHHPEFSGWRTYLLDNLLGSQFVVTTILTRFAENPKLGLMFPEIYAPVENFVTWGSNFDTASNLMKTIHIELHPEMPLIFPAGSMFWFRPEALEPLFTMPLNAQQFKENGENTIDGTIAHAIERTLLKIVEHQDFYWEYTSTTPCQG